jgi:hypothetical protein
MPTFCITWDSGGHGRPDQDALNERIRSLGSAYRLTASTWLVSTTRDSGQILRRLEDVTGSSDVVAVFAVAYRADWSLHAGGQRDGEEAAAWMQDHICPH